MRPVTAFVLAGGGNLGAVQAGRFQGELRIPSPQVYDLTAAVGRCTLTGAMERTIAVLNDMVKDGVIGSEYLLAIMLQTGRRDEVPIDRVRFRDILSRHQLTKRWKDAFGGLDG